MSKQVRVTVSIADEHLEVYKRMAALGGLSVSRCLGEWLGDTVDSALFVSANMAKARSAPQAALNELMALNASVHQDILTTKAESRGKGGGGASPSGVSRSPLYPPYSNTGVKVPQKGKNRG